MENAGRTAAALTVTFYACLTAIAQLIYCAFTSERSGSPQRVLVLLAGLLLPGIALLMLGISVSNFGDIWPKTMEIGDQIPIFYWRGTTVGGGQLFFGLHLGFLIVFAYAAALLFFLAILIRIYSPAYVLSAINKFLLTPLPYVFVLSFLVSVLSILCIPPSVESQLDSVLAWPFLAVIVPLMFLLIALAFSLFIFPITSKAYLLRTTTPAQSCYFMPCAPQHISDHDQAGTLFVGVTIFFAAEVVYPLVRFMKRRRRERNALWQELDEAAGLIELGRPSNQTAERNREVGAQRIVRTASGFEAENTAGVSKRTRGED
jgi:magnesium-transporting ATPase (P-type)